MRNKVVRQASIQNKLTEARYLNFMVEVGEEFVKQADENGEWPTWTDYINEMIFKDINGG